MMATATAASAQPPLNGVQYVDPYSTNNNAAATAANFQQTQQSTPSNEKIDISKDEVGWFFVEQYYTTMSRSPEKLHLFYSRRSQLVFGTEAQTVPVAIGQKVFSVPLFYYHSSLTLA